MLSNLQCFKVTDTFKAEVKVWDGKLQKTSAANRDKLVDKLINGIS